MKNSCSNEVGSLVTRIKVFCLKLNPSSIMSFIWEGVFTCKGRWAVTNWLCDEDVKTMTTITMGLSSLVCFANLLDSKHALCTAVRFVLHC